jgi:F-type H+-transporting ATPase subunit b
MPGFLLLALAREGSGLAEQTGFQWQVFAIQMVGFLLLLAVLHKIFWKKIFEHLARREESVRRTVESAEERQKEVERLAAEYRRRLEEFEREAQQRMNEEVRKAHEERARILQEAHAARMAEIEKAREEIRIERDKALVELRRHVVELTMLATRRILGEVVTPDVHEELVRRAIEELERTSS